MGRFHDCALTVGGDFNMTLAETQSALGSMNSVIRDCDTVAVLGEGSLFLVSAHPIFQAPLGTTLKGQDNAHDILVAQVEWPGWSLQDFVLCREWWGDVGSRGLGRKGHRAHETDDSVDELM